MRKGIRKNEVKVQKINQGELEAIKEIVLGRIQVYKNGVEDVKKKRFLKWKETAGFKVKDLNFQTKKKVSSQKSFSSPSQNLIEKLMNFQKKKLRKAF